MRYTEGTWQFKSHIYSLISLNLLHMKHSHTASPHIAATNLTFHGVGIFPFLSLLTPKYKYESFAQSKEKYILFCSPTKTHFISIYCYFPLCSLIRQCAVILCCYSITYLKERMTANLFTIQKAFSFCKRWLSLMVAARTCGRTDSCTLTSWIFIDKYWTSSLLRISVTNFVLLWRASNTPRTFSN